MKTFQIVVALVFIIAAPGTAIAEARVESNVVFGMYSGLALLMDIHYPAEPNGYGIVHVSGSGWSRPLAYNAERLTQRQHVQLEAQPLVDAGYTVFTINHRAAPRFEAEAMIEDVQRAIRFVRFHSSDYGIDADRIGAVAGSSGGHLASMAAVLDGAGDPDDPDPVNRVSAKLQCVVGRAVPADLSAIASVNRSYALALLVGAAYTRDSGSEEAQRYVAASPTTYASRDDPPFLLVHGDADNVVPFEQAGLFAEVLRAEGVTAEVIPVPGAGHTPAIFEDEELQAASISWFDRHLQD